MSQTSLAVYQKGNKFLLLNPFLPAWLVTNLTGAIAVLAFDEERSTNKVIEILSSIDNSIDSTLIVEFLNSDSVLKLFEEFNSKPKHRLRQLENVFFNMTSACNLHCIYCYAATRIEHGRITLSIEDYTRIIEDLIKTHFSGQITFTGGEPLLSPCTIPVAEYAKSKGLKTFLLTNATLINEENVDRICKAFDNIQISIDGSTSSLHDHYRGEGSYVKAIKAIELLEKNNANYRIAMTVTRDNSGDVAGMSSRWGSRLIFQPLFPLGRAEKSNTALSGIEYYNILSSCPNVNPFSSFMKIISSGQGRYKCEKCAIGDAELSISSSGDVYPCQLLHNDSCFLGNVHNQTIFEIYNSNKALYFKNHTVDEIEGCKTCDFRYLCGGACQARHLSETGSISKAGEFCAYEKEGIINGLIESCEMIEIAIH